VARYRRFGELFRGLFSAASLVAAQSEADAGRFVAIGARRAATHVIGNIKFDMQPAAGVIEQGRTVRAAMGGDRPVWIAGSTHAGEDEQVLAAHEALLAEAADTLLILAPRHPDRFRPVADLLTSRGLRFARRSEVAAPRGAVAGGPLAGGVQVLLVDTVGELGALYAAADVAFVGGSLVPIGGHNLLEPAALGIPVLTGPYYSNGKDIARRLLDRGAALQVNDARELGAAVKRLLADPPERRRIVAIGTEIIEANRGSVARLLALIEPLLREPEALPAAP
jgi:3-deoxy-D-manno-octulosonic-acid transferase